jgi:hypothetical protein
LRESGGRPYERTEIRRHDTYSPRRGKRSDIGANGATIIRIHVAIARVGQPRRATGTKPTPLNSADCKLHVSIVDHTLGTEGANPKIRVLTKAMLDPARGSLDMEDSQTRQGFRESLRATNVPAHATCPSLGAFGRHILRLGLYLLLSGLSSVSSAVPTGLNFMMVGSHADAFPAQ